MACTTTIALLYPIRVLRCLCTMFEYCNTLGAGPQWLCWKGLDRGHCSGVDRHIIIIIIMLPFKSHWRDSGQWHMTCASVDSVHSDKRSFHCSSHLVRPNLVCRNEACCVCSCGSSLSCFPPDEFAAALFRWQTERVHVRIVVQVVHSQSYACYGRNCSERQPAH